MKKFFCILALVAICITSCRNKAQEAIEDYYLTTTLPPIQGLAKIAGFKITGNIKVLYPSDTIYKWQKEKLDRIGVVLKAQKHYMSIFNEETFYGSTYSFVDWYRLNEATEELRQTLVEYEHFTDSLSQNKCDEIFCIVYDSQTNLTTIINGKKHTVIDTVQYCLDEQYNVIEVENIDNYKADNFVVLDSVFNDLLINLK